MKSSTKKLFINMILVLALVLTVVSIVTAADGWLNVGSPGFSAGTVTYISLALDGSTPYVAYQDYAYSSNATVMRFNGTSWETVGTAGFSAGRISFPSLALDGSTPYVSYQDCEFSYRATVMRYDGSIWENVGSPGFSESTAKYTSLALDGSTPYVAYRDDSKLGKATVMKYTGNITTDVDATVNDGWEYVGSHGFSEGAIYYTSLALDGSTPYVAYMDYDNSGKAAVMRFNGDSWETVGTAGFSAGSADYTSLALDGSTPYVAYRDSDNSGKATVMKFNGASWEVVGSTGFSEGTVTYTSLAFSGSTPYVAYRDGGNSDKATVMRFNGTSWETVGTAGFSAGSADYTSLALDGSTPFVAYQDAGNSHKTTVVTFGELPTVTTTSPANGARIESTDTLTVNFNRDMLHDGSEHAADDKDNYLLVEADGDGFQTSSCFLGSQAGDTKIPVLSAVYENNSGSGPYKATLSVDVLEDGEYQLLVCGSASIHDMSGIVINGGTDSIVTFDIGAAVVASEPEALPQTGFAPGRITKLPMQRSSEMYQQYNYVSLEIPSLAIEAPIVGVPISQDGWNLSWLGDQAGWLHDTAFPSWAGNSAITAHVYDANGQPGLFNNLSELKWGDEVIVHACGQAYMYEVRTVEKYVRPGDTSSVFQHEDYPWLTLITCRGYDEESDSYKWRVVVRAVQTNIN